MPSNRAGSGRRAAVFVHAHPDDEAITNAATLAKYAAEGVKLTVVTCTRGEEGEVIPAELRHLASDRDDVLGEYRVGEMDAALAAVGVSDHRWLGGPGRYRDSGMMGVPSNHRPNAFWRADLLAAADYLVAILREVRPQVVVTYDEHGGYGHPDHIQAHRVTTYAVALAAVASHRTDLGPAWDVPKVYWNAFPTSDVDQQMRRLQQGLPPGFEMPDRDEYLAHRTCVDSAVAARIDGHAYLDAKKAAMAAHATQITVVDDLYALSNKLGALVLPVESYRLAKGTSGVPGGIEDDLFAGLPESSDGVEIPQEPEATAAAEPVAACAD